MPPIISIIKPHPISSKPNLVRICSEINLEIDNTETRLQLIGKIATFADENPSCESIIRKIVTEISAEAKLSKTQSMASNVISELFGGLELHVAESR